MTTKSKADVALTLQFRALLAAIPDEPFQTMLRERPCYWTVSLQKAPVLPHLGYVMSVAQVPRSANMGS